jgi:hypothetical protein
LNVRLLQLELFSPKDEQVRSFRHAVNAPSSNSGRSNHTSPRRGSVLAVLNP